MTEARKRAVNLLKESLDATHLNRNRLATLAGVWHGGVYNAANGNTASEYTVERMKRVLYEHLMLRRDDLERDLNTINSLLARIERDELRGLCELGKQD